MVFLEKKCCPDSGPWGNANFPGQLFCFYLLTNA
jgi:hypothetical protein